MSTKQESPESLDRRKLLIGAGAIISAASAGTVLAADGHQMHSGHQMDTGLVDTALNCVKNGHACIDHCLQLFKVGDTSVAECADKVQEMLAMCTALSQLASYQSRHLKSLARVCIDVCLDCEVECRKHASMHAVCKACADACAECVEACHKVISACDK